MHLVLPLCSLALASGLIAPAPQSHAAESKPLFPPAKAGFSLQPDEQGGPSLDRLLDEFEKATGIHFVVSKDIRQVLRNSACGLRSPIDVPAASVYAVVEALLVQNDLFLVPLHLSEPCLVAIDSTQGRRSSVLRTAALQIDSAQLPRFAEHRALLVQSIIDVNPLDARMLSTSLRQMFPDQQTQSILPLADTNEIILTGWAPQVADMARDLQAAAKRERQRREEARKEPAPAEPAKAR